MVKKQFLHNVVDLRGNLAVIDKSNLNSNFFKDIKLCHNIRTKKIEKINFDYFAICCLSGSISIIMNNSTSIILCNPSELIILKKEEYKSIIISSFNTVLLIMNLTK